MRAMPLVSIVVYALLAAAPSAATSDPAAIRNVRPLDATAALFLEFGTGESARFRDLVQTLEESNVIVYVEVRQESTRPVKGGLTFLGAAGGLRWVRAVVDSGTSNRARTFADIVRLTSILGHELQHAVEASKAPSLADVGEFERYFRSIGVDEGPTILDTLSAREAGRQVADELRRMGGPPASAQRRPTHGQARLASAAP